MCYIWWSEMKNTFKDEGMLIFFIIVPLIYPLIYSWIYTNEVVREVPVAVIDMSHSKSSRTFIQHFDASPDVSVAYYCNNIAESQSLIGQQEAYGAIYIPADYEQRLGRASLKPLYIRTDFEVGVLYALRPALEFEIIFKQT